MPDSTFFRVTEDLGMVKVDYRERRRIGSRSLACVYVYPGDHETGWDAEHYAIGQLIGRLTAELDRRDAE